MLKKVDLPCFMQEIERCEYIICIGAGKRLLRMMETFEGSSLIRKIRYIADNDLNKQGNEIGLENKKIKVQSVSSLIPVLKSHVIIIITCLIYSDILEQLEKYDEFKKVSIYSFTHILGEICDQTAMEKEIPNKLRLSENMLIPKTIHYCWFGKNPIPDKYKFWMESWKKYCPDYEIIQWDETNYDISKNQYMMQAYEKKKWGFVPDYARLDIIYKYGGVYLDTDVELVKNIDELLYQKGFAGFECNQRVNLGLGFGAVAGNTLIKGMLDAYNEYSFLDCDGNINLTASPVLQTEYLLKQGLQQNGEYQIINNELTIYPEKMLCGKNLTSRRIQLAPYTCGIHHFDGSWLNEKERNIIRQVEKEMDTN